MIEENKIESETTEKTANTETNKKQLNLKRGRVFIRNLPFTVTQDKLRNLFEKYGEISEVLYQ